MNFNDFTPADLVGKLVLVKIGSLSNNNSRIAKITKATKTKIEIEGTEDSYNYNGYKRKSNVGRAGWGSTNTIDLISEEKANELRAVWKQNRERKEMQESILTELKNATHEQLTKITKILNP